MTEAEGGQAQGQCGQGQPVGDQPAAEVGHGGSAGNGEQSEADEPGPEREDWVGPSMWKARQRPQPSAAV